MTGGTFGEGVRTFYYWEDNREADRSALRQVTMELDGTGGVRWAITRALADSDQFDAEYDNAPINQQPVTTIKYQLSPWLWTRKWRPINENISFNLPGMTDIGDSVFVRNSDYAEDAITGLTFGADGRVSIDMTTLDLNVGETVSLRYRVTAADNALLSQDFVLTLTRFGREIIGTVRPYSEPVTSQAFFRRSMHQITVPLNGATGMLLGRIESQQIGNYPPNNDGQNTRREYSIQFSRPGLENFLGIDDDGNIFIREGVTASKARKNIQSIFSTKDENGSPREGITATISYREYDQNDQLTDSGTTAPIEVNLQEIVSVDHDLVSNIKLDNPRLEMPTQEGDQASSTFRPLQYHTGIPLIRGESFFTNGGRVTVAGGTAAGSVSYNPPAAGAPRNDFGNLQVNEPLEYDPVTHNATVLLRVESSNPANQPLYYVVRLFENGQMDTQLAA